MVRVIENSTSRRTFIVQFIEIVLYAWLNAVAWRICFNPNPATSKGALFHVSLVSNAKVILALMPLVETKTSGDGCCACGLKSANVNDLSVELFHSNTVCMVRSLV